jgi:hypothetical protein
VNSDSHIRSWWEKTIKAANGKQITVSLLEDSALKISEKQKPSSNYNGFKPRDSLIKENTSPVKKHYELRNTKRKSAFPDFDLQNINHLSKKHCLSGSTDLNNKGKSPIVHGSQVPKSKISFKPFFNIKQGLANNSS